MSTKVAELIVQSRELVETSETSSAWKEKLCQDVDEKIEELKTCRLASSKKQEL